MASADELAPHELVARRRRVALVEDEVDDGHHGVEALGQLVLVGDAVGDAGGADLLLGAHEPLRHRDGGHEERARDLLGRRGPRACAA